jgi:hypothetical protein
LKYGSTACIHTILFRICVSLIAYCLEFFIDFQRIDTSTSTMYLNSLNPFYGASLFILVLFSPLVFGLTTIYEAFEVASGNEPASCDKYKAQLNQFWTESQTLAQNAITVLDGIEASPADDQAAQLLCTFFGIDNNTPPSRTKIRGKKICP